MFTTTNIISWVCFSLAGILIIDVIVKTIKRNKNK